MKHRSAKPYAVDERQAAVQRLEELHLDLVAAAFEAKKLLRRNLVGAEWERARAWLHQVERSLSNGSEFGPERPNLQDSIAALKSRVADEEES